MRNRLLVMALAPLMATMPLAQSAAAAPALPQRLVTQEGLAIALASTVLQSQLEIVLTIAFDATGCTALQGGTGSIKLKSYKEVSSKKFKGKAVVYFDQKCTQPYITANATLISDNKTGSINAIETATYTNPTGRTLGILSLNETAVVGKIPGGAALTGVVGTGTFTPANGSVPVSLGLECKFPKKPGATEEDLPCQGGIAQDFPALKLAAGSVTPLHLVLPLNAKGNPESVSFSGGVSKIATGDMGTMSIYAPSQTALAIHGKKNIFGSVTTAGSAAGFSLFPPTPTGWSITDTAHDTKFEIAVIDDTTRVSKGTVTQISTGTVIATFNMDQSGTGTIRYSSGKTEPVTSWLLAD